MNKKHSKKHSNKHSNNKLSNIAVILFACIAVFGVIFAVYLIVATPARDDSFSEVYFANHTNLPGEMLVGEAYNIGFTVSASHELKPADCTYRIYIEDYPETAEILFHPVENQENPLLGSGDFMLAPEENKTVQYTVVPEKEHVRNEIYLFNMDLSYKQYLKTGRVNKQLIEAFNDTNISLYQNTELSRTNEKRWDMKNANVYYAIKETEKQLNVFYYESKRMVVYVTCNNKTYDIFLWCDIKDITS